jgi:pilus assembly protein CpaB
VLVAILVAMVVQSKFAPRETVEQAPTVEILVATKKLMTGERIAAESVRWQSWPQTAVFEGAILKSAETDPEELSVLDVPLKRDVEAGEPVTKQALIMDVKGAGNFLAASLAPGMRAVAIDVKASTGVAGFVAPGDHVDVIMSYTPRLSGDAKDLASQLVSRDATQTLLSNVKVLAVDQVTQGDGKTAAVAKTVTLEVNREQAETLVLAREMGQLSLALRRLGEKDAPEDLTTPITTDATTSEIMIKMNEMMKKSSVNSGAVRVYSGSSVQNVPVRAADEGAAAQ